MPAEEGQQVAQQIGRPLDKEDRRAVLIPHCVLFVDRQGFLAQEEFVEVKEGISGSGSGSGLQRRGRRDSSGISIPDSDERLAGAALPGSPGVFILYDRSRTATARHL